jgi:hypothetical protein
MRTFLITSPAFTGDIKVQYNDLDMLINCDLQNAQLSQQQHTWFLKRIPTALEDLQLLIRNSNARMVEVNQEITFESFWNRYNDKVRSSRKKAEKIWNRLSKANQAKAYVYISTYEASRPKGVEKKYAETYLNAELWNN